MASAVNNPTRRSARRWTDSLIARGTVRGRAARGTVRGTGRSSVISAARGAMRGTGRSTVRATARGTARDAARDREPPTVNNVDVAAANAGVHEQPHPAPIDNAQAADGEEQPLRDPDVELVAGANVQHPPYPHNDNEHPPPQADEDEPQPTPERGRGGYRGVYRGGYRGGYRGRGFRGRPRDIYHYDKKIIEKSANIAVEKALQIQLPSTTMQEDTVKMTAQLAAEKVIKFMQDNSGSSSFQTPAIPCFTQHSAFPIYTQPTAIPPYTQHPAIPPCTQQVISPCTQQAIPPCTHLSVIQPFTQHPALQPYAQPPVIPPHNTMITPYMNPFLGFGRNFF